MEMDKTIVIALSSSINLANEVVSELGIPLGKSEVKHFADGEIMVELGESVRGKHVYIIQSTCNPVSSNLMEVLIAIDACKRASASGSQGKAASADHIQAGGFSAGNSWCQPCDHHGTARYADPGLLRYPGR